MVQIAIICLILFFASYLFSKENLFSPATVVSGVWLATSAAAIYIVGTNFPISSKFTTAILLWVVPFCLASLSVQSLRVSTPFKGVVPNGLIRDIYFWICIITLPLMIYQVYLIISHAGGANAFTALRDANVRGDEDLGIDSTSSFFVSFWLVSYIIELMQVSKKNIWRVLVLLSLNLFYAVASMGKINLMVLFLATATILMFKYRLSIIKLGIGVALLFMAFMMFQVARSTQEQTYYTKLERFVVLYMVSGMPAFDQNIQPESSQHWGENTFRLYYAVANKLRLSDVKPVRPNAKFTKTTINGETYETNVYTVIYPFYKDFGNVGIVIFAIITGLLFGWIFKMAQQGDAFALCFYAIMISCLAIEFMSDIVYTILSQNIQYFIICLIPFVITKAMNSQQERALENEQV